jgi:AAA domain-containing protein
VKIIKSTDPMGVDHPIFCIIGDPGLGKTTLLSTADAPLCLDFDKGAYRSGNRKDVLEINTWGDVQELLERPDVLDPYQTIGVDTTGRCLDVITVDIIASQPKMGRDGALTQQGWGVLKTRFRTFVAQLRSLGKDVILLNHAREEKDGDVRIVRADIQGGSYAEVMKVADFVGYLTMAGKDRVLDFNPTERSIGKNPAGWSPLPIPHYAKNPRFMADLIAKGREALGKIGAESAQAAGVLADWAASIDTYTSAEECNTALPKVEALTPAAVKAQVKKLLWERAKGLGLDFAKESKTFTAPAGKAAPKAAADTPDTFVLV